MGCSLKEVELMTLGSDDGGVGWLVGLFVGLLEPTNQLTNYQTSPF
jgi:hypothetical protein